MNVYVVRKMDRAFSGGRAYLAVFPEDTVDVFRGDPWSSGWSCSQHEAARFTRKVARSLSKAMAKWTPDAKVVRIVRKGERR